MKNKAGNPFVVEFKTIIRRFDGMVVDMIDKGYVMEENGENYVVQNEETNLAVVVGKDQVIDSNIDHPDFCKCHKFCY